MKLTHEQVEKLEAAAEKATKEGPFDAQGNTHVFVEADTILTLCREWRERGERYYELLYAVGTKYPNESRHETALRYIREAESSDAGPEQGDTALKGADHDKD